jgi:hypothetical protein
MVKEQKDAKYKCEKCGVVIAVDEPCGCEPCDLVCYGVPMVEMAPRAPSLVDFVGILMGAIL